MVFNYRMRPRAFLFRVTNYKTHKNSFYSVGRYRLKTQKTCLGRLMQSTLFQQGLDLLVFGMGTVFIFLTVLVLCVYVMSKLIGSFVVEDEPQIPELGKSVNINVGSVDPKILAVVQDAIYQHRAKNQP